MSPETMNKFPIIWLTGNTGAGKTTLAKGVEKYFNEELRFDNPAARRVIVLDGDEMRATVSVDETLSPSDRRKHNLRVARLANLFSNHGFLVIVAVIAPFSKVREELGDICDPVWIYVKRSGLEGRDKPYEQPANPALTIDNDELSIHEGLTKLKLFLTDSIAIPNARVKMAHAISA